MRMMSVRAMGACCIAVVLAGCAGPVPPGSAALIESALAAYQRGDDREAVDLADRFIALHPKSQEAGEACYIRALARSPQGIGAGAEEDLRRALALTRRDELAGRAHLGLGMLAEARGDDTGAEPSYLAAIETLPAGAHPADEALFRLACLLQRRGQWLEADRRFDRMLHLFSAGARAEAAGRRVRGRAWTVQTGAFRRRSNAVAQKDRLIRAGLGAHLSPIRSAAGVLLAVRVGRYETRPQALDALGGVRRHAGGAMVTVAVE